MLYDANTRVAQWTYRSALDAGVKVFALMVR